MTATQAPTPIFQSLNTEQPRVRVKLARLLHEQHVDVAFDQGVPAHLLTDNPRDCGTCWELADMMRKSVLFEAFALVVAAEYGQR